MCDITLDQQYSSILGFTREEVEKYFGDVITHLAKAKKCKEDEIWEVIKTQYNGYSWDGITKLYNPYTIGIVIVFIF
jgi:hypothetical protein